MTAVTVIGLGYIGLPTAAMLATHGHTVHGYDVRPDVIATLRGGNIHIEEPGLLAFVQNAIRSGRFLPDTKLHASEAYILCVPTPVHHDTHKPDLSYVESATKAIVPLLKKGDLVILESTVPAGTVDKVMVPILSAAGWDCRRDLLLAHCPETVLPGNMIHEMQNNHRVIGGHTPEAAVAARDLYKSFVRADMVLTDATTAELVKLVQNTYRDINIAFANELALYCHQLGIDVRETVRLANRHPRVNVHQPGPGVGGHCIPVDPWFLIEDAPDGRLMRAARAINEGMPHYVVRRAQSLLEGRTSPVVALLGLAYKGNVDDARESPAIEVRDLLKALPGWTVRTADPHVDAARWGTVPLEEALRGAHLVLVVTDHQAFADLDPGHAAALVAARNAFDTRGILAAQRWREAGFRVETI